MKIIFQGHAFAAQGTTCQVLFSYSCLCPINAIKNVATSVDGPTFAEVHHRTDMPCLPVLAFCLWRTEQRGADNVLQPDLYSGQAVYYIKKVLGLCKSTCPTFLPKLPEAFHYKRASDKAGCWERWRSLCTNAAVSAEHLLSHSKAVFTASVPLSTQLIMQYISLYCTCLISSCVIPDGTFWKFNLEWSQGKSFWREYPVFKLVFSDENTEHFSLHYVEW